jgi:hypothetical protein
VGVWPADLPPYLNGVVCSTPAGTSALTSWPSAATGRPAYALGPVVIHAPPGPGPGHRWPGLAGPMPASSAPQSAPLTSGGGLSSARVGAISYLLARSGGSHRPGTVGDVAAILAWARGASDPIGSDCLSAGVGGLDAGTAHALWDEATRLAGPYAVHLWAGARKLRLERPTTVTAHVLSASGAGVPGVPIAFRVDVPGADLAHARAVTDADGLARTTVTVAGGSRARSVRIAAVAEVPGPAVTMTAPGRIPLVAAGDPTTRTRAVTVPIDTTADPRPTTRVDRTLVLPGTTVRPSLSVTGMRGHSGTGTITIAGPLPLHRGSGCAAYRSAPPSRAANLAAPAVAVGGDGSFPARAVTLTDPGCYLVRGSVATADAIPNVRRRGNAVLVAVVPLHLDVTVTGNGVSVGGPLSADVSLSGSFPGRLDSVHGSLLGPRPSDDGSCAAVAWPSEPGSIVTAAARGDVTTLTSPAVHATGCYAFRITGALHVPRLGTVPITVTGGRSASAVVLAPTVSVVRLAADHVVVGRRISGSVTVSGSLTYPGSISVELLHLPYDYRGCFGRDWSGAQVVAPAGAPATPTDGDGTYTVTSPDVPSDGCWSIAPVFSLGDEARVTSHDSADPMTAFTAVAPPQPQPAAQPVPLGSRHRDSSDRLVVAGLAMLALLVGAVVVTWTIARRSD